MAGGDDHTASSPAVAPAIPQFTRKKLHRRLDDVLGRDVTGTVYSLKRYLGLAVKEIPLDGLGKSNMDAIKTRLTGVGLSPAT